MDRDTATEGIAQARTRLGREGSGFKVYTESYLVKNSDLRSKFKHYYIFIHKSLVPLLLVPVLGMIRDKSH